MPASKLKIFIVDDHYLILQGLRLLLMDQPGIEVSGSAGNPAEALTMLENCPTDILLTDISMPVMSGAELTGKVLKKFPRIRVIALSMFNDPIVVNEMVEAGVSGYILKDSSKTELIAAINSVAAGRNYFSQEISSVINNQNPASRFTGREMEILRLIVKEYNNRQIAEELYISERTVETHRRNILRKADAANIVGLVKYAYAHKIV